MGRQHSSGKAILSKYWRLLLSYWGKLRGKVGTSIVILSNLFFQLLFYEIPQLCFWCDKDAFKLSPDDRLSAKQLSCFRISEILASRKIFNQDCNGVMYRACEESKQSVRLHYLRALLLSCNVLCIF